MRKEKEVVIGDETYLVREPGIGAIVDVLPELTKKHEEGSPEMMRAQLQLLKATVCKDGELLGDRLSDEVGFLSFPELIKAAYYVCESGDEVGNE